MNQLQMILRLGRTHGIVPSTIVFLTQTDLISAPSNQRWWSYSYFDATVPLVTCCTDTKMKLIAQWHKLRSILPLFEKVEQSIDFWQDSQSSIIFVWISKSISQIWNQLDFLRLVIPLCGSAWSDCSTINAGENSPIFVTSHHLVEFHADEVSSNSNNQNISIRI